MTHETNAFLDKTQLCICNPHPPPPLPLFFHLLPTADRQSREFTVIAHPLFFLPVCVFDCLLVCFKT